MKRYIATNEGTGAEKYFLEGEEERLLAYALKKDDMEKINLYGLVFDFLDGAYGEFSEEKKCWVKEDWIRVKEVIGEKEFCRKIREGTKKLTERAIRELAEAKDGDSFGIVLTEVLVIEEGE